jgi:hypothetical protein
VTVNELIAKLQTVPESQRTLPVQLWIGDRFSDEIALWLLGYVTGGAAATAGSYVVALGKPHDGHPWTRVVPPAPAAPGRG